MSLIRIALAATVVVASGCATSPGQLRDSDLNWGGVTVSRQYQAVYQDILNGLAQCNSSYAGQGTVDAANQRAEIGLFEAPAIGGKPTFAIGVVRVYQVGADTSTVAAGVIPPIDQPAFSSNQGALRNSIVRYAQGQITCQ